MRRILILILILIVLAACAQPPQVDVGRIIGKDYNPPYNTTTEQCISYTSSGVCMLWMPETIYHPAEYWLRVEGPDKKGNVIKEWRIVDSGSYDHAHSGMCWVRGSVLETGCER